jgi:hypothetical protein
MHTRWLPVFLTIRMAGLITVLGMAAFLGLCGLAQAQPQRPNILVIFGDDIGQSNISAYTFGLMGYKTPNIDRLACERILRRPGRRKRPVRPVGGLSGAAFLCYALLELGIAVFVITATLALACAEQPFAALEERAGPLAWTPLFALV